MKYCGLSTLPKVISARISASTAMAWSGAAGHEDVRAVAVAPRGLAQPHELAEQHRRAEHALDLQRALEVVLEDVPEAAGRREEIRQERRRGRGREGHQRPQPAARAPGEEQH